MHIHKVELRTELSAIQKNLFCWKHATSQDSFETFVKNIHHSWRKFQIYVYDKAA